MAVRIRLKKLGRKHRPYFRVCAMDSRVPRDGRVIEELGTYDPLLPETDARAILDGERIAYWLGVGAKPTPKVGVLIKKYGKDGSHLDQQQQALNRLAARRSDAIAAATSEAAAMAAAAPLKKAQAETAPEPEAAEPAAAEPAAAEKESAPSGESSADAEAVETATEAAAEPAADESNDDAAQ